MRIAMWIRCDAAATPGGDYTQLLNTKTELEKLGIETEVCLGVPPALPVDLVHAFNLTRLSDTFNAFRWANKNKLPFVVSSIWHSTEQMSAFYKKKYQWPVNFPIFKYLGFKELFYASNLSMCSRIEIFYSFRNVLKKIITEADLILPNSPEEAKTLKQEVKVERTARIRVVPNGIQRDNPEMSHIKQNILVCAGRIEPRKNQLNVINAFIDSELYGNWKLVFIGKENRNDRLFIEKFHSKLEIGKIEYLGVLNHDKALSMYRNAKAMILASHFETTGLVALEGLSLDCEVVMTNKGYNSFYFGDNVFYCDPSDIRSITTQLNQIADGSSKNHEIDFDYFSWPTAARLTAQAYSEILN